MSKTKVIRCAIYTRKSSEEGLEQDYNSLHAQRDACAAYILSQAGEGWTQVPEVYDDGGFSGGNIERPALRDLMRDIELGKVDVVVVYKVDRLTRSLPDFARIVEVLDKAGASFVSVTQAFNTTTSMGRLTLNVLLSFAQFEREVTGERIRDKIGASKKLGMWMGGNLALGYTPNGRTLTVEPTEAETVRMIFRRYLELGSVHALKDELDAVGVRSKITTSKAGNVRGGTPLNRGALFHILRNRLYLGEIPHKDLSYPGQHAAIIDRGLFDAVQAKLDETAVKPRTESARRTRRHHKGAPLTGLIFDSAANPMSPVSCPRKSGATYRYYVSHAVQTGVKQRAGTCPRVSAPVVEELILDRLVRLGLARADATNWTEARSYIGRIEVSDRGVSLSLHGSTLDAVGDAGWIEQKLTSDRVSQSEDGVVIQIAARMARSRGGNVAVGPNGLPAIQHGVSDATLTSGLVRAESWKRQLLEGRAQNVEALAKAEKVNPAYVQRLIRAAFLAPDLKRAIIEGRQPVGLNLQAVLTRDVPLDWDDQRTLYRG